MTWNYLYRWDPRDRPFSNFHYGFLYWIRHARHVKLHHGSLDPIEKYLGVFMNSNAFGIYLQCSLLNDYALIEDYTSLPAICEIGQGIAIINGWTLVECNYSFLFVS